jgi:hypothetical protein
MGHLRNLFVTGIPRSGTTLVAALIDNLENAVCLSEPEWQERWPQETADRCEYAQQLFDDFERVRAVLISGAEVLDRRDGDGSAVTDYFPRESRADANARQAYEIVPRAPGNLDTDFLLAMKHNAHYTCILDELADHPGFRVMAVIRHPVPTILSWRSLEIPISQGRLPAAERFWPEIAAIARRTDDILLRQVMIYGMFCERYRRLQRKLKLFRYEDVIADRSILSDFLGRSYLGDVAVRNASGSYGAAELAAIPTIQKYLRNHSPIALEYYPDLGDFRH